MGEGKGRSDRSPACNLRRMWGGGEGGWGES